MGGGTTKVGDPTDKDQQRPLLTERGDRRQPRQPKGVFETFLRFGDRPTDAVMVNNADWLEQLGYVEFLREYGVHFTINRMLTLNSVKLRLEREQPLSFLEFNYMLMQATDFLELHRRFGCTLQMGGSDQWGNIVNGVELVRRMDQAQAFGLTTPLLTTSSGEKMGKTVGGAVWLNADRLSPYDYWQMWRNTEDADVGRFLKLFTELPLDEIGRLARCAARRSTRPRRCWPTRPRRCCTAPRRRGPRRKPRGKPSKKERSPPACQLTRSPMPA